MIAKSVSDNPVRFDKDLERTSPAYCTATGRILLAHLESPALDEYFSRTQLSSCTPRTVTDALKLRQILRRARASGFVVSEDEHVLGSTGIAAPVYGHSGRVLAALDIGAITARFRPILLKKSVEVGRWP